MTTNRRGWLIVFEGIDGAGTTTHAALLKQRLESIGRVALVTCEPTNDGPIGQLIRRALDTDNKECRFDGLEMAMLFAADRRHHIRTLIVPQVNSGVIVISDRYQMSSFAYQSNETTGDWVDVLGRGVLKPDLTILVDVPVEVSTERRRKRGGKDERYDPTEFQTRVAENYRRLAREDPCTVVINGNRDMVVVAEDIWTAVTRLLYRRDMPRIKLLPLTEEDLRAMGDDDYETD